MRDDSTRPGGVDSAPTQTLANHHAFFLGGFALFIIYWILLDGSGIFRHAKPFGMGLQFSVLCRRSRSPLLHPRSPVVFVIVLKLITAGHASRIVNAEGEIVELMCAEKSKAIQSTITRKTHVKKSMSL